MTVYPLAPACLALLLVTPGVARSGSVPDVSPEAVPSTVSVYSSSESAAALESGSDVLKRPLNLSQALGGPTENEQSWWPLLYSAIIPGAGEVSMGYEKRGIALMLVEVAAWTGYFYNRDGGLDKRDQYEAYADANWNTQRWADWHPDIYPTFTGWTPEEVDSLGREKSGNGTWPGYIPWVSKEEDKQHYYENIGKYDWYISGWSDYDPDTRPHDTDKRTIYRQMRAESNDQLDTSNRFIYLSVATRVFSLVETSILIHKARNADTEEQAMLENHWMLKARPDGIDGGKVFVEMRFK